jgi:hypothetical protein
VFPTSLYLSRLANATLLQALSEARNRFRPQDLPSKVMCVND